MTEKTTLTCQVPLTWKEKIERIAAARNKQNEEILQEAIAQYLGEDILNNENRLVALQAEVFNQQKELVQLGTTVKNLQQRLQAAATMISIPDPVSLVSPPKIAPVQSDDDDLIEDEPDEILYAFLPPELR